MDQTKQGPNPDATVFIPVKRKRGRPRKDPSLKRVKTAPALPGFGGLNGNLPFQVNPVVDAKDSMVGKAVIGVVEAAFDAGYLLNVRIGNSNTTLRGVVFKPGHFTPITAENDVAPHVQMIRRNEVHLSAQKRGYRQRSRDRTEQSGSPLGNQVHRLAIQPANLFGSKGKYASPVVSPSVPPVGARGTLVPVVLQPVNLALGLPPPNQGPFDASHMTTLRGKDVQMTAPLDVLPLSVSIPLNPVMAVSSGAFPSQLQMGHQVNPERMQNENQTFIQGPPGFQKSEETTSLKSAEIDMPGEINKGVSQSSETDSGNSKMACESSAEDVCVGPDHEVGDRTEPPPFIEPQQAVLPDQNQSASVSKPLADRRTGRMTELLQENMTKNNLQQVENLTRVPKVEQTDAETEQP